MREVWRLAFLLRGSRAGARRVLARLARVRGDLDALDSAQRDRLVVLTAREIDRSSEEGPPIGSGGSGCDGVVRAAAALRGLGGQPREAWVLSVILGRDEVAMSRAMDCSRTAARRYLKQGDEAMRRALDEHYDDDLEILRGVAGRLALSDGDLGIILQAGRTADRARRLWRWLIVLLGIGLVLIVVTLAGR